MNNRKRFQFISSCILALCLVCSLVLSGNTFGVRAEEDTQQASQTQETQQETKDDPAKETSKDSDSKTDAAKQAAGDSKSAKVATQADTSSSNDVETAAETTYEFYIDKGSISFTATGVTGYIKDGDTYTQKTIPCPATKADANKTLFVITQTTDSYNTADGTTNNVSFSGNQTIPYRVLLKNVHMSSPSVNKNPDTSGHATNEKGMILIPAQTNYTKSVTLYLKGENILTGIRYYTGAMYTPSTWNKNSSLTIDSAVSGSDSGSLYIPKKVATSDIETFVKSRESYNHWNAGIGGTDSNEVTDGIHINGGTLQVLTTYGDNCSAIGGGGNGDSTIEITGGNITAISSGTGAAIGGGIGYSVQGGKGDVTISGGKVDARNYKTLQSGNLTVGGVAIGGGSSFKSEGSSATVNITGGDITAYADYGNAIGGGNSAQKTAGAATLNISGGTVKTSAIGGGSSETSVGGNAEIIANGGSVKCEKKDTFIGAFGIGGGASKAGDGGTASVTVNNGTLDCGDGVIGGGSSKSEGKGGNADIIVKQGSLIAGKIGGGNAEDANTAYAGGDASIYVTGGTLDCASIGGGNSTLGTPGAVNSDDNPAGVTVTGGTVKTGTIGGGTNDGGDIGFATADISGGTIQGQFILANTDSSKKCTFKMTDGTIDNSGLGKGKYIKAQENGGAVYLTDANGEVTLNGGTIKNSTGTLGGAIYLAGKNSNVNIGGTTIEKCSAKSGGGAYLDGGTLTMTSGKLTGNTAKASGGGAYVSGGNFKLNGKDAAVSSNTAENGAGIYLTGGKPELLAGSLIENTATKNGGGIYIDEQKVTFAPTETVTVSKNSAVNGGGVYIGGTAEKRGGLSVDKDSTGSMQFLDNKATESGGGACVDYGSFELDSDKVTMQGNSAVNGGGVAVLNGSFTQSGGIIGGSSSKQNTADNGGAVYVSGGNFTLNDGKIQNNSAKNGGGVFAAEGKVRMFGGSIINNTASADGGGMYVSSPSDPADVVLRSGTLSSNTAGNRDAKTGNGGGLAVVSSGDAADKVIIGLNKEHPDLDTSTRKFTAFDYNDEKDSNQKHNHASCMIMENNLANGNGGGIYMGSTGATLDIYCLQEDGNTSVANATGGSVMATGGQVNIGDKENNNAAARGNIVINTPMLVSGGDVDIWGNMKNPYFENNILVDIKNGAGTFEDHRTSTDSNDHHYKVQYFENFQGSGIYSAMQYGQTEDVSALGTLFTHEGYKIIEWNTQANGRGTSYPIGTKIGSALDHSAWNNDVDKALVLYAIWEKVKYTVKYDPNATEYTAVSPMEDQIFEYDVEQALRDNTFKVTGKRFTGWNTKPDGSGTAYAVDYKESKMTLEDGATITLYAQWVDCTHNSGDHPGEITYKVENNDTIVESCDCGGHTASVKLSAVDVYHDGLAHPATLTYNNTLLAGNPQITYQYSATGNGTYGALPDGETVPTSIGYYQASIMVGDKTVTVTYQIKSPATGITITGEGASGQIFADFNGTQTVSAAKDDAVTLQYTMQNLNAETYRTAPKLIFDQALPQGTSVIMITGGKYWYCDSLEGKQTVELSDFTAMGGTGEFVYNTSAIAQNQTYQFVVDYSKAETQPSGTVKAAFLYEYTAKPDEYKQEADVSIKFGDAGIFKLGQIVINGNQVTITAPQAVEYSRWNHRSLLLKVAASEGSLPSDAKLTVKVSGKTQVYTLTKAGEFIVPLSWAESQNAVFSLDSDLAGQEGAAWKLTAELFMASTNGSNPIPASLMDTGQSCEMDLTIPTDDSPSLRITGSKRLLTNRDDLPVTIEMENVNDATVHATIQKKVDGGTDYTGNFLSADVEKNSLKNNYNFSLLGITQAGSYRLLVTVTKNNQTLLSVPYYFIVK